MKLPAGMLTNCMAPDLFFAGTCRRRACEKHFSTFNRNFRFEVPLARSLALLPRRVNRKRKLTRYRKPSRFVILHAKMATWIIPRPLFSPARRLGPRDCQLAQ